MVEYTKDVCEPSPAPQTAHPQEDETAIVEMPSSEEPEKWRLAFKVGEQRKNYYDRKRAHYRECRRRDLDIPVDLEVISPDGMVVDRGHARLVNMSASGALLADIELDNGRYPVGPFHLLSQLKGGMAEGILLRCQPVRFDPARGGVGCLIEDIDCAVEE
jgi:hypothetical protein